MSNGNDDTLFGSGGSDRTVLRPTPGGRPRPGVAPARPAAVAPSGTAPLHRSDGSDANRLTGAATPLLALAARLRGTVSHADPGSLFRHVAQEVKTFEAAASAAGAPPAAVLTARYALCTLLDEAVLNTPWGSQSVWASQTLLNLFHNEGWGGEKFFQILDRLLQQPAENIELLELMYLCMAMGLQGKYRVQTAGRGQLETVETNVLHAIRRQRGEIEHDLSPHWRGIEDARPKLARYVPLWVVGAVAAGVALAVFFGLLLALNRASDPVAVQLAALGRDLPPLVERQAYVQPQQLRLRQLLSAEIGQGLLEVREQNGAETVVLREGLFASGSGEVEPARIALIESVGRALNQLPDQVLITGHTDDIPIGTLRFPSNWHLSQRRAEAVRELLASVVTPARLIAEARADSEPLVPNDSPANRALNRRVEISLLSSPTRE
jgi:type VI secretion system protein ImpK